MTNMPPSTLTPTGYQTVLLGPSATLQLGGLDDVSGAWGPALPALPIYLKNKLDIVTILVH